MPTLPYIPEQFGRYMGEAFTARGEIVFSWEELCRAAVTVGRRSWADVLEFGTYSIFEIMWRLAILRANLVEQRDGTLRKSRAFERLDPSEKSSISYFLGLVVTKLIADKLFGVTWLLHLDVYFQQLNPTLRLPNRPDFVGLNTTNLWVVIESKGRTGGVPTTLMASAKLQTRSLRNVGGELPVLRAAVASYFSGKNLRARIRDPEAYVDNAPDVPVDPKEFIRAYYRPIVEFIEKSPHELRQDVGTGRTYVWAAIPGFDSAVEIEAAVLRWCNSAGATLDELVQIVPQGLNILEHLRSQGATPENARSELFGDELRAKALGVERLRQEQLVGDDGVAVVLGNSWSEERMRQEPEDRGT